MRKRCRLKIDSRALERGARVEKREHGLSLKASRKIARDHLCENPRYYGKRFGSFGGIWTEWKAKGERWGKYRTDRGLIVTMYRKRQKVRFFTEAGRQIGPEQANVGPGIAYAMVHGWQDIR